MVEYVKRMPTHQRMQLPANMAKRPDFSRPPIPTTLRNAIVWVVLMARGVVHDHTNLP